MIARRLYRWTAARPCRLISRDGQPYLERYLVGRLGPLTCYLHRFVSGDGDAEMHDHPWRALSVVLTGGYVECRGWLDGHAGVTWRLRRAHRVNWLSPGSIHKIAAVEPETWTLFVHGRRRKGWGFFRSITVGDATGTLYYQPFPPWRGEDWTGAPLGRDAGREPFGGDAP